jgi:hypothetical protein
MRLLILLGSIPFVAFATIVLATNVFRPPPASERLAGVRVEVASYRIEDLPNDVHRLWLTVTITSSRAVDECVGFTLDEPFAGRRVTPATGVCPRPRAGSSDVLLLFEHLSSDDLQFPSHTLVWGIPGGRCGPLLEALGVCVVEQAGTASLELPSNSAFPSFGPFGTIGPLFSFPPLP